MGQSSQLPSWVQACSDGVALAVHVQPRARRSEVVGPYGDRLRIRLAAPPVDNRANRELCRFVAGELGLARSRVTVTAGDTGRDKRILVVGVTPADVVGRLLPVAAAGDVACPRR